MAGREISGSRGGIQVPRTRQLESARGRIEATISDPTLLEPMFQAAREFGPAYGYQDSLDWWNTQVSNYSELFTGDDAIQQPAWVGQAVSAAEEQHTEDEEAAIAFLLDYRGDFDFLKDMAARARRGQGFSAKQLAAVLRCKARDDERATAAKTDPTIAEATEYVKMVYKTRRPDDIHPFLWKMYEDVVGNGKTLTSNMAAAVLKFKAHDKPREQRGPVGAQEAGMYRTPDGTIYKVQVAVHGSGNLYAKRLNPPSEFGGKAEFEYESGAVRRLTPEMKMTLEEAREFGALYGTCCVCGRTLTDETSIAHGIGPVCEGRQDWRG